MGSSYNIVMALFVWPSCQSRPVITVCVAELQDLSGNRNVSVCVLSCHSCLATALCVCVVEFSNCV